MIALRRTRPAPPRPGTLGAHAVGQLWRLCRVVGLSWADAAAYTEILAEMLGPVAERPLGLPPAAPWSFLSDDRTPVEFSLSFVAGARPTLRMVLEPGGGIGGLEQSGRTGLQVVRELARLWGFDTDRLDELEDLFFPAAPQGPLALWCALELLPGGVPKVKVYLNPAASGPERATATVREALRRLGHRQAFAALPENDRLLFFALDLGQWDEPRVKVYTAHHDLPVAAASGLSRMAGGPDAAELEAFLRAAVEPGDGHDALLDQRPVQGCHGFTETVSGLPSCYTLYVPIRDYARHDREALDRAVVLLRRYGIDPDRLVSAVGAVTERPLEDGVGLIAYLALAHQQGRAPRVTAYLASEAYEVRRPTASGSLRAAAGH
ncbi:tryptophan dimethylallyltransferase family protein [Streptacidiphilus sp. P02-A3a]|uniref:tryptophan dimethylallyltransferase family protein n=1 Tax=Streptacidiphilus sp. P02-A3a TaxID=2704468 RepID=UPI001CDB4892|nr:tryptophan dimethylallyltransferase family protein [Streptacidiphilus sp. P02-A3a]